MLIRPNTLRGASGIVTGAGRSGELLQLQIFQMLLLPFGVLLPDVTMFLDLRRFPAGQGHSPLRTGHGLFLLPHLLLRLAHGLEAFLLSGGQHAQRGPEIRHLFQRKAGPQDGGITPLFFFLPPDAVAFQLGLPPPHFLTSLYQPAFLQPQGVAGGVLPIVANGQQGLQRIESLRHDAPLPYAEAGPRLQHDLFQGRQGLLERTFFLQPLTQEGIDRLDMSQKEEVKREFKESEGDPLIKGKRKQLHQEMIAQNQIANVRKAKVLVTNPTHFAVALDYEKDRTPLPVILAKGQGVLAQRMIETAREEGIPIMRNVPLARSLYEQGTENAYIPQDLIGPVAEVLRWVQSLRQG